MPPHPDVEQAILEAVAAAKGKPLAPRRIADRLGWPHDTWREIEDAVRDMVRDGRLVRVRGGKVLAAAERPAVTGIFVLTARGFGFLQPDTADRPDYFVPRDATGGAMPGDRVRAVVLPEQRHKAERRRGPRGQRGDRRDAQRSERVAVVEILERGRERWVGTVRKIAGIAVLDSPNLPMGQEPLLDELAGAKPGERVVAKLTRAGERGRNPRMVVDHVIGLEADPATDAEAIIEEFRIRHEYPPEGIDQAEAAVAPADGAPAPPGREDCRDLWCCTIDPRTAKDHDDAVSVEPAEDGDGWIVGVHIADVAHYVTPGSACDAEAKERGNSVYLLSRVVHMLPEALAADVCSLRPDVDRYAISCFLQIGADGATSGWRVAKTVIRSRRRFAYEDVQALYDAGGDGHADGVELDPPVGPDEIERLQALRKLTAAMTRRRRQQDEAIDLEIPEIKVELDDHDVPTGTALRQRLASHRLVEECMLAANRAIARYLLQQHLPYLCRSHPDPTDEKLERLGQLCELLGYRLSLPADRVALQDVADQARKRKHGEVMASAVLRTLQKARYVAAEEGHYALGWDHYTHFTSPIRRYADLRCHQILTAHLTGRLGAPDQRAAVAEDLDEACGLASVREVQAEEAERELVKLKLLRLLAPKLGAVLRGRIVAVIEKGMFVQLLDYHVEGLLKVSELGRDFFEPDDSGFMMVGKRSGKTWRIGQDLDVRVAEIDLTRRHLDLTLP